MTFGTLTIYVAAAFGALAFLNAIRWARGDETAQPLFRYTYHGMTLMLAIGSVLLMRAILTHDYRFDYVIGYSSNDLPLIYLISAFWGGQQGTFLLWALLAALIGYPLFRKSAWQPAAVMACYVPTILFQVGLMIDQGGNPFRLAPTVPPDGRGLNPLLQDPWMASHPPMVFLGYAAMTVPAVLALVALFKREESRWLDTGLRWSLIGFLSLGGGIILGGFWAYKVLGWGGYWGWDPVENASLVPWIAVTALLHGLIVQRSTGALRKTNLVLALSSYLLVLYATFLTRSGVLADFSVHSFPKGSLYRWLVAIMVVTLGVAVYAFLRRKQDEEGKPIAINVGWPFILTAALSLLSVSGLAVLIGTSMPILSSLVGKPFVPDISFYNKANLPLYIAALALLGLAPFSAWRKESFRQLGPHIITSGVLAAAGTVMAMMLGGRGVLSLLLMFVALFALFSNLFRFVAVARVRWIHTGAAIAHIGFALMFVGIIASSAWDREREITLPLGEPTEALGKILTYRGHVDGSEPKDLWRVAVMAPGGPETTLLTTMYRSGNGPDASVMRNPGILRYLTHDVYVAPLGLDSGNQTLVLTEHQPVAYRDAKLTFTGFRMEAADADSEHSRVSAVVRIDVPGRETDEIPLSMVSVGNRLQPEPVRSEALGGVVLALEQISVEQRQVRVTAGTGSASQALVVKAAIKPLMNVLWAGTILMAVGCGVAVTRRYQEKWALATNSTPAESEGQRPRLRAVSRKRTA